MQAHSSIDDKYIIHHESPVKANLRGLSTPSPSIAWASGTEGTYIRTTNYGQSWTAAQIAGAEKLNFRDIKAFDANTAYIMSAGPGALSCVYKTENSGESWEIKITGSENDFFDCMAFWNRMRGIILGDTDPTTNRFNIYLTDNGGESWSRISENAIPPSLENEAAFAASGSCAIAYGELDACFVTGRFNARAFHTHDGGKSWQVTSTPIMHDTPSAGIYSVSFRGKIGVIAGGDHREPDRGGSNLAMTSDGGNNWELIEVSPQYYWSAVSLAPDLEHLIVVGPKQAGLIHSESKYVWKKESKVSLNAVSFWSDSNRALAVGESGAIVEFVVARKM